MPSNIRELTIKDQEQVNILCETVWSGNDYVPSIFPGWVENPLSRTIGLFESEELVAFGNIERLADADIAWVQGLRVKEGNREKGYATTLTSKLVDIANKLSATSVFPGV